MQTKSLDSFKTYIQLFCGLLAGLIILGIINKGYPVVGHDYRYYIPRLIDTKLHMLINGPTIQWYTPSFGGGLPSYPNPQQMEYSIIQFFTLFMNPWLATLASTLVIVMISFMVFARLLEKHFGFDWTSSTLGAIFFIGNGFFIEHMIVGHLGWQLFPLFAIVLYMLLDKDSSLIKSTAVIGSVVAMMIHQTGFYTIVVMGLSLWIVLPLIYLIRRNIFNLSLFIYKLIFGFGFAGLLAASKIYAVTSMMSLFPRELSDVYPIGIPQAIVGIIFQLFGVMFFVPILLLSGHDPSQISGALGSITGTNFGIWETDIGLSPVLILLLMIALARLVSQIRNNFSLKSVGLSKIVAWLVMILGVWVTAEIVMAKGLFYPYIKDLPIMKSLHLNPRFAGALILPLVILGVAEYDRRVSTTARQFRVFIACSVLALVSLFSYDLLSSGVHYRIFDLTPSLQADAAIRNGERFSVQQVEDIQSDAVFAEHATNPTIYDGLFSGFGPNGYFLQGFDVEVHPGPITDSDGTYFNMTNPVSLVFPKENNLHPFERIKVSEADKLYAFAERKQPNWKLPLAQIILNWVSLITFILTTGYLLWQTIVLWTKKS